MKNTAAPSRLLWLDAFRGAAIAAMIFYHFGFDLSYFHVIDADFNTSPLLCALRIPIITSFLWISGMSLLLAHQRHEAKKNLNTALANSKRPMSHGVRHFMDSGFWRRAATLFSCAVLVSLASYCLFPQTWIYFGVLHCILISSLLAQPFLLRPKLAFAAGCGVVLLGLLFEHPFFNPRPFSWIGFVSVLPPTEDFVPIFPWFGVVLLGVATLHLIQTRHVNVLPLQAPPIKTTETPRRVPRFLSALISRFLSLLRAMGRHSLMIYMLHQPILMAVIGGFFARG
ncbi:MAG: DUF1624 domain-containing protein [Burkholderiales bacterium]|jgi:uncharacterized membrane protein|nr:DUF1624 domain-containing protein [Burkholderiales bacterium]